MKRQAKAIVAISALLLTLALSATLAAATAPVVSIDPAPTASYTSVQLSGKVDPEDEDTYYYFQYSTDPENNGWSYGNEHEPVAANSPATAVSDEITGLTPGTEYQFRLLAYNGSGEVFSAEPNPTATTEAVGPATVTIDPVTTFTGTTAHFSGTIDPEAPAGDPDAFDVNWRFECTPSCPGLEGGEVDASASGPVEVEDDAEGLDPNTTYEVTLVGENAGGPASAGPESFKTEQTAPEVQTLYAGYIDTDSATLAAQVNPRNSATTYYFEWGTDASYGNLAPAAPATLAAEDNAYHVVTAPISGLAPGATYHFRVIATNAATSEEAEGEDHALETLEPAGPPPACTNSDVRLGASAKLPDCRAYEKVSPEDKNGADIENDSSDWTARTLARAADSGGAVAFNSHATAGPGHQGGSPYAQYLSRRAAAGWATEGLNPPMDPISRLNNNAKFQWLSADLSQGVVATISSALAPGSPLAWNLFLRDNTDSSYELLTAPTIDVAPRDPANDDYQGRNATFLGASTDLSHIVFSDTRRLTADAPPESPLDASNRQIYLYEWGDGALRLASVLPGEIPYVGTEANLGSNPGGNKSDSYPGDYAVSADGSRIFFEADGRLYVRENGISTRLISASERAGDDPDVARKGHFQLATPSGTTAFFVSPDRLADGATATAGPPCFLPHSRCDLYRWTATPDGEGHHLTDLTTAVPSGAGAIGTVAGSDDGTRVYFVATGELAPGAVAGEPNLYLWEAGIGTRLVAILDGSPLGAFEFSDEGVWSTNLVRPAAYRQARLTADGRYLLIRSRSRLTAYDNAGHYQLYRYDAAAGRLDCVSCSPRSLVSLADINLLSHEDSGLSGVAAPFLPRNLTADGQTVFFDSSEALVPQDTNGKLDLYRWRDGRLSLLSSGQSGANSKFVDASQDGADVFFTTRQQLLGADRDDLRDIYDARIGGGFPEPIPPPACEGDACQPPPVVPNDPTPGSSTTNGAGNLTPKLGAPRCKRANKLRKGRCARKKAKKNRSAHTTRRTHR